jgi:hypothetical protein
LAGRLGGVTIAGMSLICSEHPDYDGNGDPPDPDCQDCQTLRSEVEG